MLPPRRCWRNVSACKNRRCAGSCCRYCDPLSFKRYYDDRYLFKLNWQISPRHKLVGTFHYDKKLTDNGVDIGEAPSTAWTRRSKTPTPGLAYTTVIARDLDRAVTIYTEGLGATPLHQGSSDLTGTDDVYVQLGDTVIQLSKPVQDGTIAAADAAAAGAG